MIVLAFLALFLVGGVSGALLAVKKPFVGFAVEDALDRLLGLFR